MNDPKNIKVVLFDFTGVVANIRPALIGEDGPDWIVEPIVQVIAGIARLRDAHIRTGLISNNDRQALLETKAMDFSIFDAMFFSSDEGFAKPDPRIYRSALHALSEKPEHCVFIDDLARNVDTALQLGMQGVVADRPSTVVDAIEQILAAQ